MEQLDLILVEIEDSMERVIEGLRKELATIRTGRANPSLLDRIHVKYYGVETPLKQISAISVVEGTQLYIKPYDKSVLKEIEHAINASDIGISPQNDGVGIRLILPPLTQERRKELTKNVDKVSEIAKVNIRNARREGNDLAKSLELPEDLEKSALEDIQKLTDKFVKKVDEVSDEKNKEIMTI